MTAATAQQTFAFLDDPGAAAAAGVVAPRLRRPGGGTSRGRNGNGNDGNGRSGKNEKNSAGGRSGSHSSPSSQTSHDRAEPALSATEPADLIRQLRRRVGCVVQPSVAAAEQPPAVPPIHTGSAGIDAMLPAGGLPGDGLTAYVGRTDGAGAGSLALVAAAGHLRRSPGGGPLVVVAPPGHFYPPAAESLGLSPDRVVWVRPENHADLVWSVDQSLRCPSVAAVWTVVRGRLDDHDARRWQLSAEEGRTAGLIVTVDATTVRTTSRRTPGGVAASFASVAFDVSRVESESTFRVRLRRCRGRSLSGDARPNQAHVRIDPSGRLIDVAAPARKVPPSVSSNAGRQDEATADVSLAAQLAHPATPRRKRYAG